VAFYRVTAPTFVAGVVTNDCDEITGAAPVLAWLCAWRRPRTLAWLLGYAARRRWTVDELVADLAGVTARPVDAPALAAEAQARDAVVEAARVLYQGAAHVSEDLLPALARVFMAVEALDAVDAARRSG
jgi:hypothetical protein